MTLTWRSPAEGISLWLWRDSHKEFLQSAYHYDLDLTQLEGVPAEGKSLWPWHKKVEGPCWGHITMTLTWQTSREFLQRAYQWLWPDTERVPHKEYHYDLDLTQSDGVPAEGKPLWLWHEIQGVPTEAVTLRLQPGSQRESQQRAYHYDLDLTQPEGVPAKGISLWPWPDTARRSPHRGISLWPWPVTVRRSSCRGQIIMTLTWQRQRVPVEGI